MRKFLLTSALHLLAPDTVVPLWFGAMICFASFGFVAVKEPYADDACGTLQLIALALLSVTYVSGGMLFFDAGNNASAAVGGHGLTQRPRGGSFEKFHTYCEEVGLCHNFIHG